MSNIYAVQRLFAHGVALLAVGVLAVSPVTLPTTTNKVTPPSDVPTVVGQPQYGLFYCKYLPHLPGCK